MQQVALSPDPILTAPLHFSSGLTATSCPPRPALYAAHHLPSCVDDSSHADRGDSAEPSRPLIREPSRSQYNRCCPGELAGCADPFPEFEPPRGHQTSRPLAARRYLSDRDSPAPPARGPHWEAHHLQSAEPSTDRVLSVLASPVVAVLKPLLLDQTGSSPRPHRHLAHRARNRSQNWTSFDSQADCLGFHEPPYCCRRSPLLMPRDASQTDRRHSSMRPIPGRSAESPPLPLDLPAAHAQARVAILRHQRDHDEMHCPRHDCLPLVPIVHPPRQIPAEPAAREPSSWIWYED